MAPPPIPSRIFSSALEQFIVSQDNGNEYKESLEINISILRSQSQSKSFDIPQRYIPFYDHFNPF